jgi:hypothetical protein
MRLSVVTLACATFAVTASGCADERSTPGGAEGDGANLKVRFTHPREHVVRYRCSSEPGAAVRRCDRGKLARLASALKNQGRRDRACTEIYGGPHRAFVTGTLRGEKVSARFTRVDGCAIADYDALVSALDDAPADDTRDPGSSGIAPPDAGTAAGHGADPGHVAVPDSDTSPPTATIVLATARDGRTLAEASQPPGHAQSRGVELREPRLHGTALGEDTDGGVARVRVSISERITCRADDGARFERPRIRYIPPPQIERIRSTPGTRLPTTRKRSLRLSFVGGRCGRGAEAVRVHGELWGEAINGSGLEAVTPHLPFVYRP